MAANNCILKTMRCEAKDGLADELAAALRVMAMAINDHLRAGKLQCGSCESDLADALNALARYDAAKKGDDHA